MPIFIDRHDLRGMTAHDIAEAHKKDLEIQADFGVSFVTYWFDEDRGTGFCLIEAPDADTARKVHAASHGNIPENVVPVDMSAVQAFLGRIADPARHPDHDHPLIEPAFRTVMFTDLVDSTAMTARLGDLRSVEMVRSHDAIVRRSLQKEDGREVKHTGDGIMAAFNTAENAVRCAQAVLAGLEAFNMASDEPIHVRIGMDAGEPVADSNDLFGATVQKAARLCAHAATDSILISQCLQDLVGANYMTTFLDRVALKGFAEPEPVYEVQWA